jgi:glucose/arabinose dehydrogenase
MPCRDAVRFNRLDISLLLYLAVSPVNSGACEIPADKHSFPAVALQEIASGFNRPVHLANSGDDSGRMFVVEQGGYIRIIENRKVLPQPFLDIHKRVIAGGEKGLLSVAFHPQYRDNGYFFVNYTRKEGLLGSLMTFVSRFKRISDDEADPASEKIIMKIKQPFENHNGGQIAFGPDGYLYIGMGDGGLANDPFGHGQDTSTLLGALLRIDVDHESRPLTYAIPEDNPLVGQEGQRMEIWAYGLRNPWRFSFDTRTGMLYLADVGQDKVEEVDSIVKGGNYGWDIMEGNRCTGEKPKQCGESTLLPPIFTYEHPEGFSITGGYVYYGESIPGLCGTYLYGDYVKTQLGGLRYDGEQLIAQQTLLNTHYHISSFGVDQAQEVYVVARQAGKILKIVSAINNGDEH